MTTLNPLGRYQVVVTEPSEANWKMVCVLKSSVVAVQRMPCEECGSVYRPGYQISQMSIPPSLLTGLTGALAKDGYDMITTDNRHLGYVVYRSWCCIEPETNDEEDDYARD